MNQKNLVYYVLFPFIVAGLCVFSYYLGWSRAKQVVPESSSQEIAQAQNQPTETLEPSGEDVNKNLTFYETLKANPEKEKNDLSPLKEEVPQKKSKVQEEKVVVQMSAFKEVGRAHELIDRLKNGGYKAFTLPDRSRGDDLHRVYVGPYVSKNEADRVALEMAKKGYGKGFVTRVKVF